MTNTEEHPDTGYIWVEVGGSSVAIAEMPNFIYGVSVREFEDGRWGISHPDWRADPLIEARGLVAEPLMTFSTAFALAYQGRPDIKGVGARVWRTAPTGEISEVADLPTLQISFTPGFFERLGRALLEPPPPSPDHRELAARSARLAARDHRFERALTIYMECELNYSLLFIAFEHINNAAKEMGKTGAHAWATKDEVKAFRVSANQRGYRHAIDAEDLAAHLRSVPHPDVQPEDARRLVHRLLMGWLDEVEPVPSAP